MTTMQNQFGSMAAREVYATERTAAGNGSLSLAEPMASPVPAGQSAANWDTGQLALTELTNTVGLARAEIEAVKRAVADLMARDELLDQLHQRLAEQSEEAFARRFTEPLTRKIAGIDRRIREQLAYLKGVFEAIPKSVWDQVPQYWSYQALNGIRVDLESILSDFGVEQFVTGAERFDRSVHEAVRKVPTTDPQRAGVVAQRVAPGFRLGDRIIVSERVAVFVKDTATR